jgi:hypothetical protein
MTREKGKLKPYMVYSEDAGSSDGASLVFARTVREARVIGWRELNGLYTDDYLDFNARLIKDSEYLFDEADKEKLQKNEPHVIETPRGCERCEMWGMGKINDEGLCENCADEEQQKR